MKKYFFSTHSSILLCIADTFVKNSQLLCNINGASSSSPCQTNTTSTSSSSGHSDHQHATNDWHQSSKHNHHHMSKSTPQKSRPTSASTSSASPRPELTTTVLLPPIDMSPEEQRALGYMPLRDDFEREYKNDAEVLLSNLALANQQLVYLNNNNKADLNLHQQSCDQTNGGNEDLIDFEFKLTLIQMYRECLTERQRFKMIARDYGLINNASALINAHRMSLLNPDGSNGML
jgi:hypothetical protein